MAKDKSSFVLYADMIHTVEPLEDAEAGRFFKHLLRYVNDQNPVADRLTTLLFEPTKQQLKRDLRKWEKTSERRSASGKKGAEVKKQKQAIAKKTKQTPANEAVNVNVNVNDNESINFTLFWDLYDKKVGLEKSKELWKKLSAEEKRLAVEYAPKYKLAEPQKKFRKNPQTFLYNKSWNDELIPKETAPSKDTTVKAPV